MPHTNKAFTLIELLVVIAIIGILASVLLVSLNTARDRARIAAAKSQLSSMRAEAELYYDEVGGYRAMGTSIMPPDVCFSVPNGWTLSGVSLEPAELYQAAIQHAAAAGGGNNNNCIANFDSWAASVELGTNLYFCIDSTGVAKETTQPVATVAVCP